MFYNFILKLLEGAWDSTSDILVILGLAGSFVTAKILGKYLSKFKKKIIYRAFKRTQDIQLRLSELRATFDAERAMVFQFHNGKPFVGEGNLHNYFLSCMYEACDSGVSHEIQGMQDIPISIWASVVTTLTDPERIYTVIGVDPVISDYTWSDVKLGSLPARLDIHRGVIVKIGSMKNDFCGFLFLGFKRFDAQGNMKYNTRFDFGSENDTLELFLEDLKKIL